ncbi:hypothetical protein [Subdoligranulum variabile]|uniref:Adenylate cyclase n=1 Tax=Subdoligranulum variabile DSM 15176 TaxID=411471 RepID=D1PSI6_9FIRM|nr:hypothetical protein [Subdoligranulum variabile]EFB74366.1 hypothetical protein SUBVAR_07369 [Subdoligranulum variabile DSM 15176]UWP69319.1 adenylate cyclase [Subdoligranulum variabile]
MGEIRTTNLRLNLEKPIQRQAWEYLQTMDKAVFKSYSQAVATALVDYFDRYYKKKEDPYLETRAREERFVQQIVTAVEQAMRDVLPLFLAGCLAGMGQSAGSIQPEVPASKESDCVNWDFAGG